jgi:predicted XRE-type DNA-binding protein
MLFKQPGMTQQKIAEELGIDQSIISDVKNGVQK